MAPSLDKLRDRWEGISPRERRLVSALGVTFVAVILAWIGLRINDGLVAIEKRNDEMRRALLALQNHRASAGVQSAAPEVALADQPVKLETYLSSIADEVGIKIPAFTPQPPVTRDDYTESSTRIEVRNVTIYELKDFLEKVESKSNLVVIKSLEIKTSFRDKSKLEVEMLVSTYSKPQEAADKPAEAAKEG